MTPRRLVALATLSSVEHSVRRDRDDCPTGPMTRDDLTLPREVTRDDSSWRRYTAHMLAVFGWLLLAAACAIGLAAWIIPVWLAL